MKKKRFVGWLDGSRVMFIREGPLLLYFSIILLTSFLFFIPPSWAQSSDCCDTDCCGECCYQKGYNADHGDESHTGYGGVQDYGQYSARFNWYQGSGCYQVNFDGSDNDSTCSWDFNGEGSSSDCVTSFTFSSDGTKLVTLTTAGGTRTMAVPAKAVNSLPDTAMSVSVTSANGMELTVTDGSTANACDASTALTAIVIWGDGTTSVEAINEGAVVGSHTYGVPGTYTISYSTRDSSGNKSFAPPQTWAVPDLATSVCDVEGNIAGAAIDIGTAVKLMENGSTVVKMGQTDASGHYSIPNVQAGRDYTIVPTRNGYEFAPATITLTLDCTGTPNNTGNDFIANGIW